MSRSWESRRSRETLSRYVGNEAKTSRRFSQNLDVRALSGARLSSVRKIAASQAKNPRSGGSISRSSDTARANFSRAFALGVLPYGTDRDVGRSPQAAA